MNNLTSLTHIDDKILMIIKPIFLFLALTLASNLHAVGLYDASYKDNLLKIPLIKAGDIVYGVTMVREESADLARIGCEEFCFRLASAEEAKDYASSIYAFYDNATGTANIDNLWFENKVYKVSLKHLGVFNGGEYFYLTNAEARQGLPVYLTSYENKNSISFDKTQLPSVRALGIPKVYENEQDTNERSITFGDFLQNGTYSAFISSNRAANLFGYPDLSDERGVGYFLSMNAKGEWEDASSKLFESVEERKTCISVSYSITADFNNDGKPDTYLACNGVDRDLPNLTPEEALLNQSSTQMLYMSQINGRYTRIEIPHLIYGHKASAADIDKDGNIDVITTHALSNNSRLPFVLFGNGDGTFRRDDDLITTDVYADFNPNYSTYWNVFMIPIDGQLNLILAGNAVTVHFAQLIDGFFDFTNPTVFQKAQNINGIDYGTPLDAVYIGGNFYFHATATQSNGEDWAILKFDINGKFIEKIYSFFNATATLQPYSAQIKPTKRGSFVAYTGACPRDLSLGMCGMDTPR